MFGKAKAKVEINPPTCFYKCNICYIGKTQTFVAYGTGCTKTHVQNLWDNSPKEEQLRRMTITVDRYGIFMRDLEKRKNPPLKIDLRDISYCCAEGGIHERIFSWICLNKGDKKLECHAVLCSSKDKAKLLAANLTIAFNYAYQEYKSEKERKERLIRLQSESATSTVNSYTGSLARNIQYKLAKERLGHLQYQTPSNSYSKYSSGANSFSKYSMGANSYNKYNSSANSKQNTLSSVSSARLARQYMASKVRPNEHTDGIIQSPSTSQAGDHFENRRQTSVRFLNDVRASNGDTSVLTGNDVTTETSHIDNATPLPTFAPAHTISRPKSGTESHPLQSYSGNSNGASTSRGFSPQKESSGKVDITVRHEELISYL